LVSWPIPAIRKKLNALFYEFVETGTAKQLGLSSPADLVVTYPTVFSVEPYIGPGLRYWDLTSEGRQWIANLHCQSLPSALKLGMSAIRVYADIGALLKEPLARVS
jgi:hypothetical protein